MATFNTTRAPNSRKYVTQQGILMPNWTRTFQAFWLHSSVFVLEKQHKNLNFQSFLPLVGPFGGYFQWNACTYFQKLCSWTRNSNGNLIKNIWNLSVTLLPFCFRKTTWKAKFSELFTSKTLFGGYFQWHTCTYFQRICSWTRYSNVKLIKKTSNF